MDIWSLLHLSQPESNKKVIQILLSTQPESTLSLLTQVGCHSKTNPISRWDLNQSHSWSPPKMSRIISPTHTLVWLLILLPFLRMKPTQSPKSLDWSEEERKKTFSTEEETGRTRESSLLLTSTSWPVSSDSSTSMLPPPPTLRDWSPPTRERKKNFTQSQPPSKISISQFWDPRDTSTTHSSGDLLLLSLF